MLRLQQMSTTYECARKALHHRRVQYVAGPAVGLILNNRDLEVVERITPRLAQKQFEQRMAKEK